LRERRKELREKSESASMADVPSTDRDTNRDVSLLLEFGKGVGEKEERRTIPESYGMEDA